MPVMDGIELYNKLQKYIITKPIPFIYLSAKAEPFDSNGGMSLGACKYLFKPVDANQIITTVYALLSNKCVFTSLKG